LVISHFYFLGDPPSAEMNRIISNAAVLPKFVSVPERLPFFVDNNRLVPNTKVAEGFERYIKKKIGFWFSGFPF
jgi:hypothetical protein